jgi:hypothetical protein
LGSEDSRVLRTNLNRLLASIYSNWETLAFSITAEEINGLIGELHQMIDISKGFPVVIWTNGPDASQDPIVEEVISKLPSIPQMLAYFDLPHCRHRASADGYGDYKGSRERIAEKALKVAIAEFNKQQ